MKKILVSLFVLFCIAGTASAQHNSTFSHFSGSTLSSTNTNVRYQNSFRKKDGTSVRGHYKTESNNTNLDNFSTQGNTNLYTGSKGTRARDYSSNANNYGSGQTIYIGSRGGQYYINSKGHKTYVPKR